MGQSRAPSAQQAQAVRAEERAAGPVVAGLVPGEGWGRAASGPPPWAFPARGHVGRPCGPGSARLAGDVSGGPSSPGGAPL